MHSGLLAPELTPSPLVTYRTGAGASSLQTGVGASSAHTPAWQLDCVLLGCKSVGTTTGAEGQVRWPQGSLSGWFLILTTALGIWQQRQGLGACQGHSPGQRAGPERPPEPPGPYLPAGCRVLGFPGQPPSPVISLQAPGLSRAWSQSGLATQRHAGGQPSTPTATSHPTSRTHTQHVPLWLKIQSWVHRDRGQMVIATRLSVATCLIFNDRREQREQN